ncbi:hypothetical protein SCHPADRAFT_1001444 [Schizopora paradoxa]|uniref:DUF6534 domain-containing protein n=1 Tax=Schizopora paradoxa TaxID=27342 RepID=A0A0H2R8P1_9AGAM|nr:hypothetical protein SCHPADRAFT_1001444 [Schizopora paradoxa]
MSSSSTGIGPLGLTMGAILVASWLAMALSGFLLFQAYHYFRGRPSHDHMFFGCLVVILCLLDFVHIGCIMVSLYHYLITNFGNIAVVKNDLPPSLGLTVGVTATITFIVQSFFSWRVWKLSKGKRVIPFILSLLITARLICGWTTTVKTIQVGTFGGFVIHVRWIFLVGLVLAVASDLLINASLCYWLNTSRNGMFHMDAILDRIILYSIETGALTSTVSITALICVATMPRNLIFIAVHFVISKLYINMFLASLNTRNSLRGLKESRHRSRALPTINLGNQRFGTEHALENSFALRPTASHRYYSGGIMTTTVTEVHRDEKGVCLDIKPDQCSDSMEESSMSVKMDASC